LFGLTASIMLDFWFTSLAFGLFWKRCLFRVVYAFCLGVCLESFYYKLISSHGLVMIFAFIMPILLGGFTNY